MIRYWHNVNLIDEWDEIESPKLKPYILANCFLTRASRLSNWERTVFSDNGAEITGHIHEK
jgi:hypothetical protein